MIRNYLKIALRNLLKNKVYSFINITGLALGMAWQPYDYAVGTGRSCQMPYQWHSLIPRDGKSILFREK